MSVESPARESRLGVWEKYLTGWVALCIVAGIALGSLVPQVSDILGRFEVAHISIPIAIALFAMIYPIMAQIDFKEVMKAGRTVKPITATLLMNWGVKPFTMALLAWLFLTIVFAPLLPGELSSQYRAGIILLGVAPCTAMVLVWSYLAGGNMGHTLVMTAINSLSMVVLYVPLAVFLLGISGITVPWDTIAFAVTVYIVIPLVAGYFTRREALKRKGVGWFNSTLAPKLGVAAIIALLMTLVLLFSLQGYQIIEHPALIGMVATPVFLNILLVFAVAYLISKAIRLPYRDAAPTAIIAGSNHFEVSIAVAITVFGLASGAVLATVVGVLTEVPIMLFLVWICKATRGFLG
ncbi:MAG: ACR3 family arsenite efflux transporter [Candidatus Bathyarchaeia archaeon]